MSKVKQQQNKGERRRRYYVDVCIQGGLVAAIVLFEVALFLVVMLMLRYNLNLAIEEQLYRIHVGPQDGLPVLISELFVLMPYIIVVNLAMVICIDWVWSNYVGRIIEPLKERLQSARSLDLRAGPVRAIRHEVLDKADSWILDENQRCRKLQRLINELSPEMDRVEAKIKIEQMRQLLPAK